MERNRAALSDSVCMDLCSDMLRRQAGSSKGAASFFRAVLGTIHFAGVPMAFPYLHETVNTMMPGLQWPAGNLFGRVIEPLNGKGLLLKREPSWIPPSLLHRPPLKNGESSVTRMHIRRKRGATPDLPAIRPILAWIRGADRFMRSKSLSLASTMFGQSLRC